MRRTHLRCGRSDEPGQSRDEFASLVEVLQILGVRPLCQSGLDSRSAHQVHGHGVDQLNGGHLCDVSSVGACERGEVILRSGWHVRGVLVTSHTDKILTVDFNRATARLNTDLMQQLIESGARQISEPRINSRIRVPEVRLVGPQGEQVGIVRIEDALRLAGEADLDLVEVAPQAKPPVCKLMDFGKWKYEAAVKARESRKNQSTTTLKEVRFRLKIDDHDYQTKVGHARRFLDAGDKVKAMIQFRGREQQRPEMGVRLLQRFSEDVADLGQVESSPRQDGRHMVMVVGPLRTKAQQAKAAASGDGEASDNEDNKAKAKAKNERRAQKTQERQKRVSTDQKDVKPLSNSMEDYLPDELKNR